MWKHYAIAAMAFFTITSSAVAQDIKTLSVGDDFNNQNRFYIVNSKDSIFILSYSKGELLLIDFWASWCTACIAKFAMLDSLQQQFAGQLKVLLVNWDEDTARINQFLKKYATRNGRPLSLPVVTGDTVLRTLFPHYSIPHYVWIYRGKVLATTGPQMVDAARIGKVLNGQPVDFKMKRDVMDFDDNKPILENGNGGGVDRQLYRSVFTRELEGVRDGTRFKRDSTTQRNMYINFPVLMLYHLVLGFDLNRIILDVPDPLKYASTSPELYSYELTAPVNISKQRLKQFMQTDLNRYLGLDGRMEKREVECYVLKSLPGVAEKATSMAGLVHGSKKAPGKMSSWQNEDHTVTYLRYVPFQLFVRDLNYSRLQWPCKPIIINESGYTGNISVDLPIAAREDMGLLKNILLPKGFSL